MNCDRIVLAGTYATLLTAAFGLAFLIPVVKLLAFIAIMMPPWVIDDLGVVDLGSPKNGFFIPNVLGYTSGGGHLLVVFLLMLLLPICWQ